MFFLCDLLSEEQDKIEEQRKWVDAEIEKVLEQRRQNEELERVSVLSFIFITTFAFDIMFCPKYFTVGISCKNSGMSTVFLIMLAIESKCTNSILFFGSFVAAFTWHNTKLASVVFFCMLLCLFSLTILIEHHWSFHFLYCNIHCFLLVPKS